MKERQVRLGGGEALEGDIWIPDPLPFMAHSFSPLPHLPHLHAKKAPWTKGSNDTGRMKVL